ncbi:hypothetical protein [Stenotrophomonas sp. VV52]|uniref:hypothetical protein n=1 Tax=Stenotrophomonas sp. VV52 TaxID=2066958 RepID=UPI000C9E2C0E|nr:hypothetical protein [Stenotrophomonas sp. VV52]
MSISEHEQQDQTFLTQFFDFLEKNSATDADAAAMSAKNRMSFVKRDPVQMKAHFEELVLGLGTSDAAEAAFKQAVLAGIQSRSKLGAQIPALRDAAVRLGAPSWAIPAQLNI